MYNSLLGSNALVSCSRYGRSSDSFLSNCIQLSNNFVEHWCLDKLTGSEINSIDSLLEIVFIREGYSVLPVHRELSARQITDILTSIATNYLFTLTFNVSVCSTILFNFILSVRSVCLVYELR